MIGLTQAEAAIDPAKPALLLGDDERSFGELEDRVERLSRHFVARGLAPGDPVAVMLPNGFEFMEVGLASARAGLRLLPVNWHLKSEEVAWILGDAGTRLLVVAASLVPIAAAAAARAPGCELLVVGDDSASSDAGSADAVAPPRSGYEEALAGAPGEPVDWRARDGRATPRYLFYTSGTTGRPRGVERDETPDPDSAVTRSVAAMWGLRPEDVFIVSSPLYHAAGSYAFISLFVGSTIVLQPRFSGADWLRAVERHRVSTSLMVPAHFIRILEVPEEERRSIDTSSMRLILHSAAPCPIPVKRRIMEALPTAAIWEFYGASEGGATKISPEEWLQRPGSVGRPWPGVEITIRGPEGERLPAGETGLIYVSAPRGRFRYHNDEEKTRGAWIGDTFTLGDVGHLDDDGYLYITDRAADMVIRGGVNIYPVEIEQAIHTHPDVVDCAVFGIPDARLGEIVMAMVETRRPLGASDLQAWCRQHLADFKCPEVVRFVDELPRDPSGKVRKRYLRDQVVATGASPD